ncbi:MAG: MATE family efflux transporter, partial [Tissierellia bacterium]|nr:MATE family efflux transporter [Tissierellia bacterium]
IAELYGMADSLFVGNFVSDKALASLSIVYPIQKILIAMGVMFGVGFATQVSKANGSGDEESIKKSLVSGLYSSLLIMLLTVVFLFLFKEKILYSVGATRELIVEAKAYFNFIIIGAIFINTGAFISHVLLSFGNSRVSLFANLIGCVINVILDYILIVKLNYGVTGAGFATMVSQVVAFIYAFSLFRKFTKENKISLKARINIRLVAAAIAIGVSAFAVESVDGVVTAVLNVLASAAGGEKAISILGISLRIYMFLFLANFAVAAAMQPMASYSYGAGNHERLRDVVRKSIFLSTLVQVISLIICMIYARELVSLFTSNQALILETEKAFKYMIIAVPASSVYYISIFYFQALGRVKTSLFLSVFRHIFIMLPLSLILVKVFNMGLLGVWISYPISDIVAGLFSIYLLKGEREDLEEMEEELAEKAYAA